MKATRLLVAAAAFVCCMGGLSQIHAQTANVVSDNFTGTETTNKWIFKGNACLTAGDNTANNPSCPNITDTAPNGALRLTDAKNNEAGAIIIDPSKAFSSQDGIQVTFTTYTYGGDSGGTGKDGADGIGFYLIDASYAPSLGAFGGSLGYSCSNSNSPHDGMAGGYIGLGMDEFGNFLNSGDNTVTGVLKGVSGANAATSNSGAASGSGTQYQPGRIGLRGAGNINLTSLQQQVWAAGGTYTPTETDVYTACSTGTWSFNAPVYKFQSNSFGTGTYRGNVYVVSGTSGGTNTYAVYSGQSMSGLTLYGQTTNSSNATVYEPLKVAKSGGNPETQSVTPNPPLNDYAVINGGNLVLPTNQTLPGGGKCCQIAKESATTRSNAIPISYKLQITNAGSLSLWYSYNGGTYNTVLANQSISASNGTMPASFLFGFGGSTGGDNNVHEITCFLATPANLSASSAGVNVQQTGEYQTGTQVFLAYYHTNNWWGELTAQNIMIDSSGNATISSLANWDASCVLTGGGLCTATNTSIAQGQYDSTGRTLITYSNGPNNVNPTPSGIPFTWGRLTTAEQGWLNGDGHGSDRVDFLSGKRTNEIPSQNATSSQIFRVRTSVLGDIINSSPTWVGPPSSPYTNTWKDNLNPSTPMPESASGVQSYATFTSNEASRINVVYQGANDGFMHAFEAGYYNASGTIVGTTINGVFTGTLNDGKELFAYMPEAVLSTIYNQNQSQLDYSSPNYSHNYFVDATPGTGDLFYSGKWHTWLAGGLGAGGNAIYVLDITDLGNTSFSVTPGVGNVIGEWSTAISTTTNNGVTTSTATSTLSCNGNANCGQSLGQTYGTPQIRRLHNGEWGIIFGNGLNSLTGDAGIYVMTITGAGAIDQVYYLSTGVGSATNAQGPNGIAYVTPADLDGDHITDYVYAGDMYGNVWRFDLTSSIATNWAVSTYGNKTATPLFTTPSTSWTSTDSNGNPISGTSNQPIMTQVEVLSVDSTATGQSRVMVDFGTGSVTPQTTNSAAQYAGGQQALYGIWDWNLGTAGTAGAGYAGLSGTNAPTTPPTIANLQQQTITSAAGAVDSSTNTGIRTVSTNLVCFVGSNCGSTTGTQYGWYLNLPGALGVSIGNANQTEQVVFNPIESEGAFIVNTDIPANNSPLTCSAIDAQGWTMAIDPATGGAFQTAFFATSGGTVIGGSVIVSGIASNATGSPSIVTANGKPYMINQTQTGVPKINQVIPPPANGQRLTWLQLH